MHLMRTPVVLGGAPAPARAARRVLHAGGGGAGAAPPTPRRAPRCRAGAGPGRGDSAGGGEEGAPDSSIDELAAMLSRRAAEMRRSSGEPLLDAPPPPDGGGDGELGGGAGGGADATKPPPQEPAAPPPPPPRARRGGAAAAARPAAMPPSDGSFIPADFQVFKTLGQLAVSAGGEEGAAAAAAAGGAPLAEQPVFVYIARYTSGMPFEGPATVLLKEYQAASASVAANEALVMQRLLGPLPERKWQVAVADANPHPPVVQLLGWLQAPCSDAAYEITGDNREATWLVYRFEGLKPLSIIAPRLEPPRPPPGLSALLYGGRAGAARAASAARRASLRALARRLLGALSFCHARGVAHCCLGAGSVQISNLEDRDPDRVIVKLDNWGLARLYPGPLQEPDEAGSGGGGGSSAAPPPPSALLDDDSDAGEQRRADLQAAGLLLLEAFAAGTAGGAAAAALVGGAGLRRLLFEVFHDDIAEFRSYCEADEGLQPFVEFADDTGAWGLLGDLLRGEASAGELLRTSPFFAQTQEAPKA
ncbi:MAG: hypothetical protein J3K34DRAFT_526774 [Monoraphidium minutum]|nr:MAG: hypothetical protein J3K34DRAFT_526774 [Monoraphidium minutum]